MPNWCSTHYEIKGSKNAIMQLNNAFNAAFEEDAIKNGFGKEWLGNILAHLGYDEEKIRNGNVCRCRGSIAYIECAGNTLTIDTETAWAPMHEPIYWMVESYAPNATVHWMAVEPGCGIFERNYHDSNEWFVDDWDGNVYGEMSSEALLEYLQEKLDTEETDLTELLKRATEELECCSINHIDEVDEWI